MFHNVFLIVYSKLNLVEYKLFDFFYKHHLIDKLKFQFKSFILAINHILDQYVKRYILKNR